jgi:hypothetical protein
LPGIDAGTIAGVSALLEAVVMLACYLRPGVRGG